MVFVCCVPDCRNISRNKTVRRFPRDFELCKQWCVIINREDLLHREFTTIRKNYVVCDDHFEASVKYSVDDPTIKSRTRLKCGAVPSVNLPGNIQLKANKSFPEEALDVNRPGPSSASTFDLLIPPLEVQDSVSQAENISTREQKYSEKVTASGRSLKGIKGRVNFLHKMNLYKKAQLTPKKKKLYETAKEYLTVARRIEKESTSNTEKFKNILEMVESAEIFKSKVNTITHNFLRSQLKQQCKKKRGRRFTLDDKLLGLMLLKQSPKGYKLLQKLFALPSRKTLTALLKMIPFNCGLNATILNSLQQCIAKLDDRDKNCILLLDEISLHPSLFYNKSEDCFEGFEDDGQSRSCRIADHAMVFMIKGVSKKWKQPITYYFCENGMKSADIVRHIKEVIRALQEIGLRVISTVCDQYNKAAINMLVQETKSNLARIGQLHNSYSFFINDQEIMALFDPPHLLKGIRNNLLLHDVKFKWKGNLEIGKWEHIQTLYEIDGDNSTVSIDDPNISDYRMLNRLTEFHIYPDKIKKMKVKNAAQVFSQRVSAVMRKFAQCNDNSLPKEAEATANFLLFIDRLFDSVNASTIKPQEGKLFRCAVTSDSPHIAFWTEAKQVLQTVKFLKKDKNGAVVEFVPPTVKNWILTIDGFINLWRSLSKNGFSFMLTRHFNQDALENFFGCIRNYGARNVNPTCTSFRSSFKSLIINNFTSTHSPGFNCEEDHSDGVLDSLKSFITPSITEFESIPSLAVTDDMEFTYTIITNQKILEIESYLTGYLARKILKVSGRCKFCHNILISDVNSSKPDLITYRAYSFKSLLIPRTKFATLFNLCYQVAHYYVVKFAADKHIKSKILSMLRQKVTLINFPTCDIHDLYSSFFDIFTNFYLFTYVGNVNKLLKGTVIKTVNDVIKQQALHRFRKYKKKQAAIKQQKKLQL